MTIRKFVARIKSWITGIFPVHRDAFWTLLIFFTTVVVWHLWSTAHDPRWLGHLRIDPIVYHARAMAFFENQSWAGTGVNEYQPGALWFFVLVAAMADSKSFDAFLRMLFFVNCLILCLHIWMAAVTGEKRSPWIMLLLAAATGPILLFRFELLVSLLVLSGWMLWQKRHLNSCAFLLGVAMATKIYPVLLAPLLAYDAWRTGGLKKTLIVVFAGFLGLAAVAISLPIYGAQGGDLAAAVKFHLDKPYGIDGLPGSLIPLVQDWLGIPLRLAPRNGIHGFESDLGIVANALLNWTWIPIALSILFIVARNSNRSGFPEAGALFALFGMYVGLGKLMVPQYTWWALSFLPFAKVECIANKNMFILLALLVTSLTCGHAVYPLNYSDFINIFSGNPTTSNLFWVNFVKNLIWLAGMVFAIIAMSIKRGYCR
jgi:hypothetical protein